MLGLADRGRIRRLLQLVLSGDATRALAELDEAHELGIDPTQLLRGLMESAPRRHAGQGRLALDALQCAEEREGAAEMAQPFRGAASIACGRCCSRGLQDVEVAPDPREAAEMALLRLIHAADLPDPAALAG